MDISYYLKIRYTQKNDKYPFLNCWGLVCEFYKKEKGVQLDYFSEDDLFSINSKYNEFRKNLKEIQKPYSGIIVAFFKNNIIKHVGILIAKDRVLHTDRVTRIQKLSDVVKAKNYSEVKYYDL